MEGSYGLSTLFTRISMIALSCSISEFLHNSQRLILEYPTDFAVGQVSSTFCIRMKSTHQSDR